MGRKKGKREKKKRNEGVKSRGKSEIVYKTDARKQYEKNAK